MPPSLTGLDPAGPPSLCPNFSSRGGSRNSLGVVGQGQDVNYCPVVGQAAAVAKFPYTHRPLLVYSLISPSSRPHRVCCCCMVAFMAGVVNNKADPPCASCHELMN